MRAAAAWCLVSFAGTGCGGGGGGESLLPCGPAGECPAGFECRAKDRLCYRSGSGELADARPPDAPPLRDAPPGDAGTTDARPPSPDAPGPDAAIPGPPVLDFRFEDDMVSSGTEPGIAFNLFGIVVEFEDARSGRGWKRSDAFNFIFEADTTALFATDRPFTLSIWFLHRAADDLNTSLFSTLLGGACGLQLGIANLAGPRFLELCANNGSDGGCRDVVEPPLAAWHNALVRYDRSTVGLFIDGNLGASLPAPVPLFSACTNKLGVRADGALTVDDLRFYEGAFAAREQCVIILGGTWSGTSCVTP